MGEDDPRTVMGGGQARREWQERSPRNSSGIGMAAADYRGAADFEVIGHWVLPGSGPGDVVGLRVEARAGWRLGASGARVNGTAVEEAIGACCQLPLTGNQLEPQLWWTCRRDLGSSVAPRAGEAVGRRRQKLGGQVVKGSGVLLFCCTPTYPSP